MVCAVKQAGFSSCTSELILVQGPHTAQIRCQMGQTSINKTSFPMYNNNFISLPFFPANTYTNIRKYSYLMNDNLKKHHQPEEMHFFYFQNPSTDPPAGQFWSTGCMFDTHGLSCKFIINITTQHTVLYQCKSSYLKDLGACVCLVF